MTRKIIVGITGASGAIYAVKLIETLLAAETRIHLIISEIGAQVFTHELQIKSEDLPGFFSRMQGRSDLRGEIIMHDSADMFAPAASGSFSVDAMVIVPCSMKTLSAVASGYSSNLLERAADVTLKERRPLILVTRETPLGHVHLRNMLPAHESGATIMPASPGFYHHPQAIDDLAAFMVGRILDHLKIEQFGLPRWGEDGPLTQPLPPGKGKQ